MSASGIALGFSLARERLRGPSAPLIALLSCGASFAISVLLRRADARTAPDDALTGAVFGLAVPLLAYFLCERLCAGVRLDRSVDDLARYGTSRRTVVLGLLLASALCGALLSALLCAVTLFGAHARGDATLVRDLRASLSVALLTGASYALWFGAASLFGKRGGGRRWALVLDFVLGAGSSVLALPWPRAHVRNLLGGAPALDWSQTRAWFALGLLAISCLAFSVARTTE